MGDLYDADFFGNRIVKITPAGTASIFASALALPRGLAFDRAGNLFVANAATSSSTIVKITPAGVKSTLASGLSGEALRDREILDAEEIPEIETMKAKIAESDAALEERHQ